MSANFALPYATLTELPPQGALLPIAPADIPVFLFCSSTGTPFTVTSLGSQQQAAAEVIYGAGPVREGGYIAAKTPVQTVWVKVPATGVAASASAIDHSLVTGTLIPGAITGTISDGYDVWVKCTTTGTTGTSYSYAVSLDGGSTYGTPISVTTSLSMAITGTLNGTSIATTMLVALTTAQTFTQGDVFKFWTQPASASVLPLTTTRVASSTSAPAVTGTPNDGYEPFFTFGTLQGTTGTVGVLGPNAITYTFSLDGGITTSNPALLSSSGVIVIPDHRDSGGVTNQTGLTLTMGAGTIDAGDTIAFRTTPPVMSFADIATAMDAVRNSQALWSFFYLCGSVTATTRNSIETKVQQYAASGRFTWCSVQGRDLITGERVAASTGNLLGDLAWSGRIASTGTDGWAGSFGNRTPGNFGYARVTDPLTGRRQRRPSALHEITQALAFTPDTNPGQYSNGPLSSDVSIVDRNGVNAEHDARINPQIYALGGNVLRTWEGEQGILPGLWCADGHLFSADGDMTDLTQRRILNQADASLLVAMRQFVLGKYGVNPSTARNGLVAGNVSPPEIVRITQVLRTQVVADVSAYLSGSAGGVFIVLNPVPGVGGALSCTMQLLGKNYIRGFKASAGFVSAALLGIVTPA